MNIKEYMEEVCKHCDNLKIIPYPNTICCYVENNEKHPVIGAHGNCNLGIWNNGWLRKNIREFNEAGYSGSVYVQELFPDPQDFIKFYKKVIKEIENEK